MYFSQLIRWYCLLATITEHVHLMSNYLLLLISYDYNNGKFIPVLRFHSEKILKFDFVGLIQKLYIVKTNYINMIGS